jgi:hypothetical protein
MKRRRPSHQVPTGTEAVAARTGEHCPESGWWFPRGHHLAEAHSASVFVSEGSIMPPLDGSPTLWLPGPVRPTLGDFQEESRLDMESERTSLRSGVVQATAAAL